MTPFRHSPALEAAQLADEADARRWLEMHMEMTSTPRDFHLAALSECGEEETENETNKTTNQQDDHVIPTRQLHAPQG